ncbi:MAG: GNAT family N-acetyltransferase [Pseudomonadota bacterium]
MSSPIRLSLHPSAAERAALADLQAASWRDAYRGVLPDAFLDGPAEDPRSLAARLGAEWSDLRLATEDLLLTLGDPLAPDAFAVVLGDPGASRTVAEAQPSAEAPRPYLDHLHARPAARGQGLGEALLRDAARRLIGRDRPGLWLWVFEVNDGARRFYARLGAQEEARARQAPYGQPQPCLRLGWDAAGLAALARPSPDPQRGRSAGPTRA